MYEYSNNKKYNTRKWHTPNLRSYCGKNKKEIIKEASNIIHTPVDVVEWRADWFQDVDDYIFTKI